MIWNNLVDLLKGKVNKKDRKLGKYALIEWKKEARKFGVGGTCMKEIRIYDDNTLLDIREYTQPEVKHLETLGIPVIPVAKGSIPPQVPEHVKTEIFVGVIKE